MSKPMKEVSFNLPTVWNDGTDATDVIRSCIGDLVLIAGGATVNYGNGYWRHDGVLYDEPVATFVVAVEPRKTREVFTVAVKYADRLKQEALYFKDADGTVRIIDTIGPREAERARDEQRNREFSGVNFVPASASAWVNPDNY